MAGKTFLDRFEQSLNLANDGSQGKLRGEPEFNVLGVNTDREAIAQFLSQFSKSPATLRAYTKETERFQMWAVLERNKSIADLVLEDYQAYIEFLKFPDPSWITPKKVPRSSPDWKPFTFVPPENELAESNSSNGLSRNAVQLAINALGSMLSWMVASGYLRMNVLAILKKNDQTIGETKRFQSDKVERFLDDEMWDAATRQVEQMPRDDDKQRILYERLRFLLSMFSMVGARVAEASAAEMNSFSRDPGGWFWNVLGKGSKSAIVAMPQDMVDALMRWRKAMGLSPLPTRTDSRPVLPALNRFGKPVFTRTVVENGKKVDRPRHGLSARRINEILKELFEAASQDPLLSDDKREAMRKASAHWLRHTSITQKIHAGMTTENVQNDARHSDGRTTRRYMHDLERARHEDAQKHRLRWVDADS